MKTSCNSNISKVINIRILWDQVIKLMCRLLINQKELLDKSIEIIQQWNCILYSMLLLYFSDILEFISCKQTLNIFGGWYLFQLIFLVFYCTLLLHIKIQELSRLTRRKELILWNYWKVLTHEIYASCVK